MLLLVVGDREPGVAAGFQYLEELADVLDPWHAAVTAAGVMLAGVGGATLFEYVTGMPLGVDLVIPAPWYDPMLAAPGRMSIVSALSFVASGLGITAAACLPRQGQQLLALAATVVAAVRDEGPCIPPEEVAKVFKAFYQIDMSTTRHAGGTGLGLATAKALVEAHDGKIGVSRERGCMFWFQLPARGITPPIAGRRGQMSPARSLDRGQPPCRAPP